MPVLDADHLARELLPDGTLPPPWERYPEMPAGVIGWRMGYGESYLDLWWHWSQRRTRSQLIDYFRQHAPLPVGWVYWAVSRLEDLDAIEDDGQALDAAVSRFAAEGLCDLETWRAYWGAEP